MSAPFQFRQFAIRQDNTPMKVGTDGVLLGSWCSVRGCQTALDIGTGTGLIALMLAQRNPHLQVTALEPHPGAFDDASFNFSESPFGNRIQALPLALQSYTNIGSFDLIVANPPYFSKSHPSDNADRNMARHQDDFKPQHLAATGAWLSEMGVLSGIYPLDIYSVLHETALNVGLHLRRKMEVKPTPQKPAHRILFEYSKMAVSQVESSTLVIESGGRHTYSPEYIALTHDFYLDIGCKGRPAA